MHEWWSNDCYLLYPLLHIYKFEMCVFMHRSLLTIYYMHIIPPAPSLSSCLCQDGNEEDCVLRYSWTFIKSESESWLSTSKDFNYSCLNPKVTRWSPSLLESDGRLLARRRMRINSSANYSPCRLIVLFTTRWIPVHSTVSFSWRCTTTTCLTGRLRLGMCYCACPLHIQPYLQLHFSHE
jgi:hypothetical protein